MLATAVIGLREGLEAALIVGIIAAFLRQNGRADALRAMWLGVGAAVLICLAVGVALQAVNTALPQRQQEMLECIVAGIAVLMVSYMVLWMRNHSRGLKAELQAAAGGALARGSATALVVMAFLAVFREGFETAVFLLAAFQSSLSAVQAVIGAVLGIGVALLLGYLLYRGGVRLNLAKFFKITGVVLVLVAGGLVMSTLRAAYEAGWITIGQQTALRLGSVVRPGSVVESLLTGVLGIRSTIPVIELTAYLLFVIPMLAVVVWPPKRLPAPSRIRLIQLVVGAVAILAAAALAVFTPAAATASSARVVGQLGGSISTGINPDTGADLAGTRLTGAATVSVRGGQHPTEATITVTGGLALDGTSTLTLVGHRQLAGGLDAIEYQGSAITSALTGSQATTAGLPAALTGRQATALAGGRLPVGLRGRSTDTFAAGYTDTAQPTVLVDSRTGTVLGLDLTAGRTITLQPAGGDPVPAGRLLSATLATDSAVIAGQSRLVQQSLDAADRHQLLGQVFPALLGLFGLVVLAFAARPRRRTTPGNAGPTEPVDQPSPQLVPTAAMSGTAIDAGSIGPRNHPTRSETE